MTGYAFGDDPLARERLALVADTFAPPTVALLAELAVREPRRYVLDLGCGPGHTTALLRAAWPHAYLTGIDSSAAMVDEARDRVSGAHFVVGDITGRLRLPAHVAYARLVLGHLPDPRATLAAWAGSVFAGAWIVCEEPVRYRSDDPVFTEYEAAVTAVVAARGGQLWAADTFDADPPGCARELDRVVEFPVPAARAAAMFWRNAAVWDGEPRLIEALRAIEHDGARDSVTWELRQTVWRRRG